MWRDICVHNADAIAALLAQYRARIARFEALLAARDGAAVETIFARAKGARDSHYQKEQSI